LLKGLKDTSLANDYWPFNKTDGFDIRVLFMFLEGLDGRTGAFHHFLTSLSGSPVQEPGFATFLNGMKGRLRTSRGV